MTALSDALADARFRRDLAEFLAELAAERMMRTPIEERLRAYTGRLSPGMLAEIGGDHFPTPLAALVGGRR